MHTDKILECLTLISQTWFTKDRRGQQIIVLETTHVRKVENNASSETPKQNSNMVQPH